MKLRCAIGVAALGCVLVAVPGQSRAAPYNEVHKCDEFAAHPDDPKKWAQGVTDDDLLSGPALRFCEEAVRKYPDTPRFHFQFGRALAKAGLYEKSVKFFVQAAAARYAAAYLYLGDAYLAGVGLPDGESQSTEHARSWYQRAADAGIDVEGRMAEVDAAESGEQGETVSDGVDPSRYIRKDILVALYKKDFDYLNKIRVQVALYFVEFNKFFQGDNALFYQSGDLTCQNLYDPGVHRVLVNDWLFRTNPVTGSHHGSSQARIKRGMDVATRVIKDFQRDPMAGMGTIVNWQLALQEWKEQGVTDAKRLVVNHGCDHDFIKTVYRNAREFFRA